MTKTLDQLKREHGARSEDEIVRAAKDRDQGCFYRAEPGEMTFTLLERDPDFAELVSLWAFRRHQRVINGEKPESDIARVKEAMEMAELARKRGWRKAGR